MNRSVVLFTHLNSKWITVNMKVYAARDKEPALHVYFGAIGPKTVGALSNVKNLPLFNQEVLILKDPIR